MKLYPRSILHWLLLLWALSLLTACIQPQAPTAIPPLDVAGEYKTVVTLTDDNSCGNVTVQSLPTTIQQAPGATEFIFRHAGNDYTASLDADGTFATEHKRLVAGSTIYTVTFAGTFSTTEFSGTGRVERQQTQVPTLCSYVVRLEGVKQ